ncbi:pyridoxal phosphate-dependent aminotransferase [Deinococcus lacus]|uniref:Histidinol-phosphate aminotransferase n=1 Tax=Deinococcus lacus TaxID=392561 RepID=A0ABW1YD03_9DEIO
MTKPHSLPLRESVRRIPAYPYNPSAARIKLDQNESPYDFPAELKALAAERMLERSWNRYPDLGAERLRAKVAAYENWDEGGVVLSAGSNVLIKIMTELAGIDQTVLTTAPTFAVYNLEAQMLGAKLVQVPLQADLSLPVEGLKAALKSETPGVLAVIQPHAPTGHVDSETAVRDVVEAASGWTVMLDEAYRDYAGTDYRDLVRAHPGAMTLRTFSKAWGLAGIRLGYVLTHPELAAQIRKLVPAFSINVLTECVAEVALEHPQYMQQRVAELGRERERIMQAFEGHAWQVYPSHTNFFLVKTPDDAAAIAHLAQHDLVVRPQAGLPVIGDCLRVTVGSPAENDALIAAIEAAR